MNHCLPGAQEWNKSTGKTKQGREERAHITLLFSFEYRKEETSPGELKAFGFDYYCIELGQGTSKQSLVVFVLMLVQGKRKRTKKKKKNRKGKIESI